MKTVLNVKTDKDVKEKAQQLAQHLGIPLSTIVNAHLKNFIASGEFRVAREPEVVPAVRDALKQELATAKTDAETVGPFATADEAIAALDA